MKNNENLANVLLLTQKVIVEAEHKKSTITVHNCDFNFINLISNIRNSETFDENILSNLHLSFKRDYAAFLKKWKETPSPDKINSINVRIKDKNDVYQYAKIRKIFKNDSTITLLEELDEDNVAAFEERDDSKAKLNELEKKYNHDVNIDSFTGCYNMNGFNNEKDDIIKTSSQSKQKVLCCMVDLNGLKYINDTYGHESGDIAIKTIAGILKKSVPNDFYVFRKGGDEFMVIGASDNSEKIKENLSNSFELELKQYNKINLKKNKFLVDMSYGFQISSINNESELSLLIQKADKEMYQMKNIRDPHARDAAKNKGESMSNKREYDEIIEECFEDDDDYLEDDGYNWQDVRDSYDNLEEFLLGKIHGQDAVVRSVVKQLFERELFPVPNNPKATLFFFGPSGTGKTYLANLISEYFDYPMLVVNMADYTHDSDKIQLLGSEKSFRGAAPGQLFDFFQHHAGKNKIVVLDEFEKSHYTTKIVFLAAIGQGNIYSPYYGITYNLEDTIFVFTSNAARELYEDTNANLSALPLHKLVSSLSSELDRDGKCVFPPEFISRAGSNGVYIFNHLSTESLVDVVTDSFDGVCKYSKEKFGIEVTYNKNLPTLFIYHIGKGDARVLKSSAASFIKGEIYQIIENIPDESTVESININFDFDSIPENLKQYFVNKKQSKIIQIDDKRKSLKNSEELEVLCARNVEELNTLMEKDIDAVFINPLFEMGDDHSLSITDYNSTGIRLFYYVKENYEDIPVYLYFNEDEMVSDNDVKSLLTDGARKILYRDGSFKKNVISILNSLYMQNQSSTLFNQGVIIDYKTREMYDSSSNSVHVELYDFKKFVAYDSSASEYMVSFEKRPNVSFKDIIGANNAKEELNYFIKYLKNPRNKKMPKGVLLYGPAGTGKTSLAKAMAHEADLNFMSINAADVIKEGTGGIRMIDNIFKSARKYAPTVLFIDEIDAIGKKRSGSFSDAVLNALLTQMDGFKTNAKKPVFVLAATNYGVSNSNNAISSLDEALVRRFDSTIYVDLPQKNERTEYIKLLCQKMEMNNVTLDSIENLANCTVGFSLAKIENILNFVHRYAIRNDKEVDDDILFEAYDEYLGGEKRETNLLEHQKIAIHEAGHAFVSYIKGNTPVYLTIDARSNYGGYVNLGEEEKILHSRRDLLDSIDIALAGRASEEVFFNEEGLNTGASTDLLKATSTASMIVEGYGLNGTLSTFKTGEISLKAREEVEKILQIEYDATSAIIKDNKETVKKIADALITNNHLTKAEFLKIVLDK